MGVHSKFSGEDKRMILTMREYGFSVVEIAAKFSCTTETVYRYIPMYVGRLTREKRYKKRNLI